MSSSDKVSFLPDDYLANKQKHRANMICAALFVIVVTAIAAAIALSQRSLRQIESEHASIEKQYDEAAKRIDQVKQLQQTQQAISHEAELASSLLEKVPRSNLLAVIANSLPTGVSLIDLTLDSKARPVKQPEVNQIPSQQKKEAQKQKESIPQPKLYDVTVKLTGVAADDVQVAQFIRNLSSSRLLQDVNLVVVEQAKMSQDDVRKFELEMMINPSADLQADNPLRRHAGLDTRESVR